ncbi:MAG: nuclear transport factor 2 family protein [Planctomycetota bacterium]
MACIGSIGWMVGCAMLGLAALGAAASVSSPLGNSPAGPDQDEPWEFRELQLPGGLTLRCAVVLPPGFDASRSYPVLLGLPPGDQSERMVIAGLARYWGREAASRGWVVISPAAPAGQSFVREGASLIPDLVTVAHTLFRAEGGRLHLAGVSNGGRSAFRAAIDRPLQYHSLTVLPGYPPDEADTRRLHRLRELPVTLFAGGDDAPWVARMRETQELLVALGARATLEVFPNEGHVPPSLTAERLFETLDARRREAAARPEQELAIGSVLDALHEAAAVADANRYFDCFTPDAEFVGTDASERWSVDAFRRWSAQYFARASAWVYHPATRHIARGRRTDGLLSRTPGPRHLRRMSRHRLPPPR